MNTIDKDTIAKDSSFELPNVMDVLKNKHAKPLPSDEAKKDSLLPKELDCCDAATD